jgi:hypothetical protein
MLHRQGRIDAVLTSSGQRLFTDAAIAKAKADMEERRRRASRHAA